MVNHGIFLDRLMALIQADETFAKQISEFRIGDQGDDNSANAYPLLYVTTAGNPEVSRRMVAPAGPDSLPWQEIIYEYWVIVVVNGPTATDAQRKLYALTQQIEAIFETNTRLKLNDSTLCATLEVNTQRRHEKHRGSLVEAATVRVRPTKYVAYSS